MLAKLKSSFAGAPGNAGPCIGKTDWNHVGAACSYHPSETALNKARRSSGSNPKGLL
jgi:hypothetical protein